MIREERALVQIDPQTLIRCIIHVNFNETLRPFLLVKVSTSQQIGCRDENCVVMLRRVTHCMLWIDLQQRNQRCSDVIIGKDVRSNLAKIHQ